MPGILEGNESTMNKEEKMAPYRTVGTHAFTAMLVIGYFKPVWPDENGKKAQEFYEKEQKMAHHRSGLHIY